MKHYSLEKLYNGRYDLVHSSSDLGQLMNELVKRVQGEQGIYSHRIRKLGCSKSVIKYDPKGV